MKTLALLRRLQHPRHPALDRSDGIAFGWGRTERWPGVVRQRLGADWLVVEEGLGGRTTVLDDPIVRRPQERPQRPADRAGEPPADRSGRADARHQRPQGAFAMTAIDIARAATVLVERIRGAVASGPGRKTAPNVLLVAPPPCAGSWPARWKSAPAPPPRPRASARSSPRSRATYGVPFLDAATVIAPSPIDGVHFDGARTSQARQRHRRQDPQPVSRLVTLSFEARPRRAHRDEVHHPSW